uniref:Uncharacterized protein n=1 Tax=Mola mola TaxID=94237 RepID=A0A3Q4A8N3_MOLML
RVSHSSCKRSGMRRVIAEDPDWTLITVPCLSDLCLQCIVANFEGKLLFYFFPQYFLQEKLSTSLQLHVTAGLIGDGVYWRRCCEQRWDICDVSCYDHSWKRMFLERHMEELIELFIPNVTDPMTVLEMVTLCGNYVKRLEISQLLPPVMESKEEEEEEESGLELERDSDRPSMDHFDFSLLLHKLSSLEELHLMYQVKQCGMNFEWTMFEMSDRDCESLAKALKSCQTLKLLRLHQSHLEDKKCCTLVESLLDHPSLRELDFSHNQIGDKGAKAISKLLNRCKLETLNVCDNNIGAPGAKAIAHALSENSTLLSLNLRLNRLRDEGGEAIGEALLSNSALRHLHLGGNEATAPTAMALAQALVQNTSLKSISLSCNNLGVDGGRALEEALTHNSSLTECDMYLTEVDEQSALAVKQALWNNVSLEQKRLESTE